MHWWKHLIEYFEQIGRYHHVNPAIYVGIHFIATPLFAAAVGWIFYNRKKKRPLTLPVCVATLLFNTSNLYLIIFGNKIPFWIYALAGVSTLIGGYITVKKIRKRMHAQDTEESSRQDA